jgi:uncharacterized membrane protein YjgN (DUF898 family)
MNISFNEEKGFYSDLFITCFLIIISLGLYLPWGITKLRKNIWSKISLNEERFYYIGQAKELLMGYLFLLGLYGLSKLFQFVAPSIFGQNQILVGVLSGVGSVVFFTLFLKSRLGSFRYQVHRTVYSGIRLSTDLAGPKQQYWMCLKWGVVCALTLGLGMTYFFFKIDQIKYNSLKYGDEKFRFTMTFSEYIKMVGVLTLKLILMFIVFGGIFTFANVQLDGAFLSQNLDKPSFNFIGIAVAVIFFGSAFIYLMSSFMVQFFKAKIGHFSSDHIKLETSLTVSRVIKYNFINLFIVVFTLGLGFPLVLVNNVKLFAETISVKGLDGLLVSNEQGLSEQSTAESFDDLYAFDLNMFDAF